MSPAAILDRSLGGVSAPRRSVESVPLLPTVVWEDRCSVGRDLKRNAISICVGLPEYTVPIRKCHTEVVYFTYPCHESNISVLTILSGLKWP